MNYPVIVICLLGGVAGAAMGGWWIYARYVRPNRALHETLAELNARVRELEQAHRDEGFHLHAILDRLTEGVLIVDRTQKIRLVNPGLRAMFDFSTSPLNRTLLETFRHHDVYATVRAALTEGQPQTCMVALATRQENGRYVEKHFQLTATSLPSGESDGGKAMPSGAIAIFHDVTQLKALEAVRRDFVANVSHELRTPLSIINGYVETLLEPDGLRDEASVRRFLAVMGKHGQRLGRLLEDLLTLARLESGNGKFANHADDAADRPLSDLRAVLLGVVERLAPVIAQKEVSVQTEIAPDLPLVEAEVQQLDQAFGNLLENALKHGGRAADPPVVRIQARCDSESADQVEITFADDGPGIPLSDQPHLFERFYRVHKDRSRDAGGTGLGLAIVKHIVQAHGGQVTVESVPGAGATFRVRLPCRPSGSRDEDEAANRQFLP